MRKAQKMNLNHITMGSSENKTNDEGYQIVTKRRKKIMGTGIGDKDFHGKSEKPDKKLWLFISKVPDSVNADHIKSFIITKTNCEDIQVKLLPTDQKRRDNQCFMIGVLPDLREEIYNPAFWPKKIGIERFNFRLGRRFLDREHHNRGLSTGDHRPDSFLV
uniref:Uncharacterized protein LOC114347637 n=1 Tax=Diabrotica virgifera virgifera TaxID=50390 RepID=A0A6P7HEC8_DIAVI